MKTVVSYICLCAFAALALTACKKVDAPKVTGFTATIAQLEAGTKTHAVKFSLVWDEGDQIKVLDEESASFDFTVSSSEGATATFVADSPEKVAFLADLEAADYVAFYPNAVVDGEFVKLTIPAEQEYVPGFSFATDTYPMVGFNEGRSFKFLSNAGFLNVSFRAPEGETRQVDKVVLIASEPVAGKLAYSKDGMSYSFYGESNVITLKSTTMLTITDNSDTDFTFILPEGALFGGFTVEVYDGETLLGQYTTTKVQNLIVAQTFREMPVQVLP